MSQLTYNNVQLQFLKTNVIERTPRMSDDKTEYMWTDFYIDVISIYNPAATSYSPLGVQQFGNLPMVTDSAIRSALLQPRRALTYEEGGISIITLLPNLAGGGAIDCDNGPIPQSCTVVRITSSHMFWVQYSIRVSIIECNIGAFISPIASSRYTRSESIDLQYRSTLTTSGIAVFRSNVLASLGADADSYRGYLIPAQLLGYQRTNISFNVNSDGSRVEWSTTDVEQLQGGLGNINIPGTAASIGITKVSMKYHIGQHEQGPMGIAGFGSRCTVSCAAWGTRFSDTFAMILFLFTIAVEKLQNILTIGVLSGADLTEDVFEKIVQINMSYICLPEGMGFNEVALPMLGSVGDTVQILSLPDLGGICPQPFFESGTRGTAAYMLAVNAFGTACFSSLSGLNTDDTGTIVPPNSYSESNSFGTSPSVNGFYTPSAPSVQGSQSDVRIRGTQSDPQIGADEQKNMNIKGSFKSQNKTSKGIITLPIASSLSSSSGGDDSGSGNPTCVNVQLFQPITKKVVEWSVERIGAVPQIPNPIPPGGQGSLSGGGGSGSGLTLLSSYIAPIGMEVMPDGYSRIYRISGTYEYSMQNPLGDNDPVQFDIPTWLNILPDQTTQLAKKSYTYGVINNPTV